MQRAEDGAFRQISWRGSDDGQRGRQTDNSNSNRRRRSTAWPDGGEGDEVAGSNSFLSWLRMSLASLRGGGDNRVAVAGVGDGVTNNNDAASSYNNVSSGNNDVNTITMAIEEDACVVQDVGAAYNSNGNSSDDLVYQVSTVGDQG